MYIYVAWDKLILSVALWASES